MDNSDTYYLALAISLAVLLGLSAFFGACEMAFSSLNRIKLKNMAAKNRRARLVLAILDAYDKFLSTVLIGNNIVNISSSALATVLLMNIFGAKGVSLATLIMTVLIVIFGEITPKTLAKESPEQTALNCAPLLRFFIFLFTPLNYLSAAWKKFIVKIFPPKLDRAVTEDELLTFVEEVRQEGGINRQEEEMIRQAIEFDDLTAGEIFTPRIDIAAVAETDSAETLDLKFAETGFSRLPVYRDSVDNIIGVILLKDFHHEVMKGRKTAAQIVKPVVFVTRTIKISKLLRTMQQKQTHLAILVDEYGGTVGMVTIEDIVEELVGEIWDEHDEVVEPVKKTEGGFAVLGSAGLRDMLNFIGADADANGATDAQTADTDDAYNTPAVSNTTVGNWIMENFGRLPHAGESFVWRDLRIQVTRVMRHRVMEAAVAVIEKTPAAVPDGALDAQAAK